MFLGSDIRTINRLIRILIGQEGGSLSQYRDTPIDNGIRKRECIQCTGKASERAILNRKALKTDALDAFFESIEETNEHGRSINISDSSSESDVAEKASAFTLPDDLNDARDEMDDSEPDSGPEYMLKPDHKDIDYPAYGA